ncbi:MAG: hypothetical protein ACR2L6_06795 [Gemmatimonadaceae bacterium]
MKDLTAIAAVNALIAAIIGYEAWIGHYRSGFVRAEQWIAPSLAAALFVAGTLAAAIPSYRPAAIVLEWAGLTGVAGGALGLAYHHWFGMVKAPGGYRLALHHSMYGAPPLAPLALSEAGALAFIVARELRGTWPVPGLSVVNALLIVSLIGLAGALAQTALLHYRGAFNTPYMYLPFGAPVLALIAGAWYLTQPGAASTGVFRGTLILTFLTGVIGLGLHLRGLDRQMAGLHVPLFNVLQGPPALAPAFISAVAAIALLALALQ